MVQGAAMPRSTCSPSGTSDVVVSAATAPEIGSAPVVTERVGLEDGTQVNPMH